MWLDNKVHIYRGSGVWCECGCEYQHEGKYKLVCPKCGSAFEFEPTLWDLVKDLREQRGLSIRELAKLADVNSSTVYRIEHKQVIPRRKTVLKLAEVLEADKAVFLEKLEEIIKANGK